MKFKKTYRLITATLFAVLFFTATFCDLFMIAGYYIDTPAYAVNCINKDKPQIHCNGKCQLQKNLNSQENKDKPNTERKSGNGDEVLSSKTFFASVDAPLLISKHKKYFNINNAITVDKSLAFFHPPQNTIV